MKKSGLKVMVFRKCTTLTWKIKIELQGHSSVLLKYPKDLWNELKKLLECDLSIFINLRFGSKWDSFAQTDMYFGIIQIFDAYKFQFMSEWFFTRIEILQGLKKTHFTALRKMLGSKNQFLLVLNFIFRKKDQIKRPNKFLGAYYSFFYTN